MWRQNKLSCRWQWDCKQEQQLSVAAAMWGLYNALSHKSVCLPLATLPVSCVVLCLDFYRRYQVIPVDVADAVDDPCSPCCAASVED